MFLLILGPHSWLGSHWIDQTRQSCLIWRRNSKFETACKVSHTRFRFCLKTQVWKRKLKQRKHFRCVSVPGENSDRPTSTGEGAAGTTGTRTADSDGGATSEQERSSSRSISVGGSFDIFGGQPRTGVSPTWVMDSSERSSEPIDGTVAAASGEQVANSQGRIRTPVRWGQGIPIQPAMTIQPIRHKSSPTGTNEHSFGHPSKSCFGDQCGHEVTKAAWFSPSSCRWASWALQEGTEEERWCRSKVDPNRHGTE